MAHYRRAGAVPRKRHTQHRRPDGGLYHEELVGEEGSSSDSSLPYHPGVPSALVDARPWQLSDQSTTPNAPLLPRHAVTDVLTKTAPAKDDLERPTTALAALGSLYVVNGKFGVTTTDQEVVRLGLP